MNEKRQAASLLNRVGTAEEVLGRHEGILFRFNETFGAIIDLLGPAEVERRVNERRRAQLEKETAANDAVTQNGLKEGFVSKVEAIDAGKAILLVVSETAADGSTVARRYFDSTAPFMAELAGKGPGHEFKPSPHTTAKILEVYSVDGRKYAEYETRLFQEKQAAAAVAEAPKAEAKPAKKDKKAGAKEAHAS
jgi:hypothetical protein